MPVPEDIYQRDVDFTALALKYPEFAKKSAYLLNMTTFRA